jgi:hypothetical protein
MIKMAELTPDRWSVDLPDEWIEELIFISDPRGDVDDLVLETNVEEYRERLKRIARDYVWNHALQFAAPLYLVEQFLRRIEATPENWLPTVQSESQIDELPAQVVSELRATAERTRTDLGHLQSPHQLAEMAKVTAERVRGRIEEAKREEGSARHQGNVAVQELFESLVWFWIHCYKTLPTMTHNPDAGEKHQSVHHLCGGGSGHDTHTPQPRS